MDNKLHGFLYAEQHRVLFFFYCHIGWLLWNRSNHSDPNLLEEHMNPSIDYTKRVCRVSIIHQFQHNERAKGIKQIGL